MVCIHPHSVDSCLRNAPPVDQWDGERLLRLRVSADDDEINMLTAVMSDYEFYCNGTITQWRLQWHLRSFQSEQCTVTFTFYTLRPVAGVDCTLTPMGSTTVTEELYFDTYTESIFNVSIEDRMTVSAGDIVGLRAQFDRDCDDVRLWIAGTRFADNTVYHDRIEEEVFSQPSALDTFDICGYERDEISPYITAVVGKFMTITAEECLYM